MVMQMQQIETRDAIADMRELRSIMRLVMIVSGAGVLTEEEVENCTTYTGALKMILSFIEITTRQDENTMFLELLDAVSMVAEKHKGEF